MLKRRLSATLLAIILIASQTVTVMANDAYSAMDDVVATDGFVDNMSTAEGSDDVNKQVTVFDENDNIKDSNYTLSKNNTQTYGDTNCYNETTQVVKNLVDVASNGGETFQSDNNIHHLKTNNVQAFQQVKAGIFTGDTTYDATAGTPTTENLFVDYGGSQYLVDIDYRILNAEYTRKYTFKADTYNYLYYYTPYRYNHVQDGAQVGEWKNEPAADREIQYHYVTDPGHDVLQDPKEYTGGNAAMRQYAKEDNSEYNDFNNVAADEYRYRYARYNSQFNGNDSNDEQGTNHFYSIAVSEAICFKNAAIKAVNKLADAVVNMDDNYRKDQNEWTWEPKDSNAATTAGDGKFTSRGNDYMFTYGGIVRLSDLAYSNDSTPESPGNGAYGMNGTDLSAKIMNSITWNDYTVTEDGMADKTNLVKRAMMTQPYFMSYLYDKCGYYDVNDPSLHTVMDTWANTGKSEDDIKKLFATIDTANSMIHKDNGTLEADDPAAKYYCVSTSADSTYRVAAGDTDYKTTLSVEDNELAEARFNSAFTGGDYSAAYDWTMHDYVSDNKTPMYLKGIAAGADSNTNYNEIANLYYKQMYSILYYLDSMFYSDEPCLCPTLPGHNHKDTNRNQYVSKVLALTFNKHQHGNNPTNVGSYNFMLTLPLAILPPGGDLDATADMNESYTDPAHGVAVDVAGIYNQFLKSPQFAYGVNMRIDCDYGFDYSDYYDDKKINSTTGQHYWQSNLRPTNINELYSSCCKTIDGRTYFFGQTYKKDEATRKSNVNLTNFPNAHQTYPIFSGDVSTMDTWTTDSEAPAIRYIEYYPISSFSFVDADYSGNVNGFDYYGNFVTDYTKYKTLSYKDTISQKFSNVKWMDIVGYRIYDMDHATSKGLSSLLVARKGIYNVKTDKMNDPNVNPAEIEIVTRAIAKKGYVAYDLLDKDEKGDELSSKTDLGNLTNLDSTGRLANSFYPGSNGNTSGAKEVTYRKNVTYGANDYKVHFMYAYRRSDVPILDVGKFVNDDPHAFVLEDIGSNKGTENSNSDELLFVYRPMSQGGRSHTSFTNFVNQGLAHTLLYPQDNESHTPSCNKWGYYYKNKNSKVAQIYRNSILVQGDFILKGVISKFEANGNKGLLKRIDDDDNCAKLNLLCGSKIDSYKLLSNNLDAFNLIDDTTANELLKYHSADAWIPTKYNRIRARNDFIGNNWSNDRKLNDIFDLLTNSYAINKDKHTKVDEIVEDSDDRPYANGGIGTSRDLGDVRVNADNMEVVKLNAPSNDIDLSTADIGHNANNDCCYSMDPDVPIVGYDGSTKSDSYRYSNGYSGEGNNTWLKISALPMCSYEIKMDDFNDTNSEYTATLGMPDKENVIYYNNYGHGTETDKWHTTTNGKSLYQDFYDIVGDSFDKAHAFYDAETGKDAKLSKKDNRHKEHGHWLSMWYPYMQDVNISRYLNNGEWWTGVGTLQYKCISDDNNLYKTKSATYRTQYRNPELAKTTPYIITKYEKKDDKALLPNNILVYDPIASETAITVPLSEYRWDEYNRSTADDDSKKTYMGYERSENGKSVKRNQVSISRSSEKKSLNNVGSEVHIIGEQLYAGIKTGEFKYEYVLKDTSDADTTVYTIDDYIDNVSDSSESSSVDHITADPVTIQKTGTYDFSILRGQNQIISSMDLSRGDVVSFNNGTVSVKHNPFEFAMKYSSLLDAYCEGNGLSWDLDGSGNLRLWKGDIKEWNKNHTGIQPTPYTDTDITTNMRLPFNGVYTLGFTNVTGASGVSMKSGDHMSIDLTMCRTDDTGAAVSVAGEVQFQGFNTDKLNVFTEALENNVTRIHIYCKRDTTLTSIQMKNPSMGSYNLVPWYIDITPFSTDREALVPLNIESLYDLIASIPDSPSGIEYSLNSDVTTLKKNTEGTFSVDWESEHGSNGFKYNAAYVNNDNLYVYTNAATNGEKFIVTSSNMDTVLQDKVSPEFLEELKTFSRDTAAQGILQLKTVKKYTTTLNSNNLNPHKVRSRAWGYYVFGWLANNYTPITRANWLNYFNVNGDKQMTVNTLTDPAGNNWDAAFLDGLTKERYTGADLVVVCVNGIYYLTINYTEEGYNNFSQEVKDKLKSKSNDVTSGNFDLVFNNINVKGTIDTVSFGTSTVADATLLEEKVPYKEGTYQIMYKATSMNAAGLMAIAYDVKASMNLSHKYTQDHPDWRVDWKRESHEIIRQETVETNSNTSTNPNNVSLDDEFAIYWDNCTDLLGTEEEKQDKHRDKEIITNTLGKGWEDGHECNSGGYLETDQFDEVTYVYFKQDAFSAKYNSLIIASKDHKKSYSNVVGYRLTDTTKWIGNKYLRFNVNMYAFIDPDDLNERYKDVELELGTDGYVYTMADKDNDKQIVMRNDDTPAYVNPTLSAFTGTKQNKPVLVRAYTPVYLGYQDPQKSKASSNDGSFIDYGYENNENNEDATTRSSTEHFYTYHFYCPLANGEAENEAVVEFGVNAVNAYKTGIDVTDENKHNNTYVGYNHPNQEIYNNYYESAFNAKLDMIEATQDGNNVAKNTTYPIYTYDDKDKVEVDEWGLPWLRGVLYLQMNNNKVGKKLVVDGEKEKEFDSGYYVFTDNAVKQRPTSTRAGESFAIIGSIGGLTILDSGDPRWQDTFKKPDDGGNGTDYAISPIVHKVSKYSTVKGEAGSQRNVFGDISDVRGRYGNYLHSNTSEYDAILDSTGKGLSLNTYNAKWYKDVLFKTSANTSSLPQDVIDNIKGNKDKFNFDNTPVKAIDNIHNEGNLYNILNTGNKDDQEKACIDTVRLGYLSHLSIDTIGNYYGSNSKRTDSDEDEKPVNGNNDYGQTKIQIRPVYYLEYNDLMGRAHMIPVDVYMRSGANYRLINLGVDDKDVDGVEYKGDALQTNTFEVANNSYYSYAIETNPRTVGLLADLELDSNFVQSILRYSITSNERIRTNAIKVNAQLLKSEVDAGNKSSMCIKVGKGITTSILDPYNYVRENEVEGGVLTSYYTYGSAQMLFLREYNRTFMGGSTVALNYQDKFKTKTEYPERYGQSWYFDLGLPETSVFVKHGKILNNTNIQEVTALKDAKIVVFLDVYAVGEKYVLHYDSSLRNSLETVTPNSKVNWRAWLNDDKHKYLIPVQYYELDNMRSTADKSTKGSH